MQAQSTPLHISRKKTKDTKMSIHWFLCTLAFLETATPYINIMCADSDGKKPQVVVLTERMAQDIVREVGACLSVLRAEQEKREE